MSVRGNLARWHPPPKPPPPNGTPLGIPSQDAYTTSRLATVRAHIERIDRLMQSTKDGQQLNWLATAQDRLAEQERKLAGRPLPGSRRPREEKPPVSRGFIQCEPLGPAQVQDAAPAPPAPPP